MTITQYEYIVAVDTYRHFATAAAHCHVTQPTLSMQIQKLEDQLGIILFDRDKHPVLPTDAGVAIINQARQVIAEHDRLIEIARESKNIVAGTLSIGIIPTLAPYLLPLFVNKFLKKYPDVTLQVWELTTEQITDQLKRGLIDCGLMAVPIEDNSITSITLFYERLIAYVSPQCKLYSKKHLVADDLEPANAWILQEGHCLRNQLLRLCNLKADQQRQLAYESGSLETLKRLVDLNGGFTILPELAVLDLPKKKLDQVRYFRDPAPVREIALVTHRSFIKRKLLELLANSIKKAVPKELLVNEKKEVVGI
jgi:LysR family transcriptional regulator, hydrogen peroxide-inducible genes activator